MRTGKSVSNWLLILLLIAVAPSAMAAQPNIVLILADDHGYADLGAHGAGDVLTPSIDRLARQGVRFTDFYANHPICAPSRAGLLTARYQQRFGFENNPGPGNAENANGMPDDVPMVQELLKARGYTTGMTGKWHLGYAPNQSPTARGFDFFYGTLHGAMAYVPDGASGVKTVLRGTEEEPMPAHVTEAFGDEAVSFIERNKDDPFFLYVSFTAVHAPMQTTAPYLERFPDEADETRRIYLGMLAAMDDAVGDIVAAVDDAGLAENTLIVYTSDNGGPTWQTTSANTPLNGVKALTLEGGIRVPTIARWPGRIPTDQVLSTLGIGHDLTATALAVAGIELDARFDGVDLMPYMSGAVTGNAHDQLFWRMGPQAAVRQGPWKLVKVGDETFLFNLDEDIGERTDISAQHPERVVSLESQWREWSDQLARPMFGRCADVSQDDCVAPQPLLDLVGNYIAGRPVNPRPLLYGGGPEK